MGLLVASSFILITFATFAAAATFGGDHTHHFVPGFQRMRPKREEVPRPQRGRQTPGLPLLQHVDNGDDDEKGHERARHAHQDLPSSQRQTEDEERQQEEAEDDVDRGEPAVGGRDVAQGFGQSDGESGEWNRIPQNNARDVEQKVYEGNLEKP